MKDKRMSNQELSSYEPICGHRGCAGCGATIAVRLALKALGERVFVAVPAGCVSAIGFVYPQLAFNCNAIISTFPGTASMLAGIAAGAKALGLRDVKTVGFAGDGGTADIGLQALSGALDRGDPTLYICYDNEAYMNTGVQRSGLTLQGARTTTTPARSQGCPTRKKNLLEIVAAHGIPYAATASVGHAADFIGKVKKAAAIDGPTFLHVFAPCPTGWGTPADSTLELAREAVGCGLWPLLEYERGEYRMNRRPKPEVKVADYLKRQKRFKHLTEVGIAEIEAYRDALWARLERLSTLK
jgi:pyruvate ferredoxin oxidoreductase beta subunit